MKVGFTGTRNGMTNAQQTKFTSLLVKLLPGEFHHGDCVGADTEAATIAYGIGGVKVVCHPPSDESLRAFNPHSSEVRGAKGHLARNRDIVNECDVLIATPREMTHQTRGGTWYTIDYGQRKCKRVIVIYPDGSFEATVPDK